MIILKSALFILILIGLALVVGQGIAVKCSKQSVNIAYCYIVGMLALFSLFHFVAIIFTYLNLSLSMLILVYMVLLSGLLLYLYYSNLSKIKLLLVKRINFWHDSLFWPVLGLVVFQVAQVCLLSHTDADDATYVGIATTAVATDSLNQFNPLTGMPMKMIELTDYKLAPFSLFWAMWAKIFMLHPAVLMHTLCPILLISMSYAVYYLVGQIFFQEKKKIYVFLIFVCLLNIWGNWAIRSTSSFLLFRIWQGKAMLASVLIPFTIYVMAQVWKEDAKLRDWILLALNSISCCFVSGMGAMLFPVLVMSYGLVDVFVKKRWNRIKYYILCLLPCMISAVLYVVLHFMI